MIGFAEVSIAEKINVTFVSCFWLFKIVVKLMSNNFDV